ncbi:unnamed protein product [marine sediment metagenome]|uniref:Uncharacterized protein n=1 Tax=marine sediment metagenome TaxID=412755 RepID=X1E240_9ZZZZ
MAKIRGPIFSLESSGGIGKKIISQRRKKVKYAKKYSKPKNPRTEIQQENRNYITLANTEWKTGGYSNLDKEAWNFYARIKDKNISGYNAFIKFYLNAMVNNNDWTSVKNCKIYDITSSSIKISIDIEFDKEGILYLGSSKYSMAKEYYPVFSEGKYIFNLTELDPDTKYFFYIKNVYTP